jgi:hypothetical protein
MKNLNSIYNSAIFSFKQNLFKSLFAFLFSSFVLGFANIICSFIIILTSKTYILPFVSLFVLLVINTALNFGLQLLIFFLYKNEYAVIGHLFYFFKDLKRISLVCIFQIISYFILIYISFIPYMFLGDASQDVEFFTALLDFQTLQTESTNIEYFKQVFSKGLSFGFLLSTIICVILVLLFHLITSFIPFKMYENPNFSVFKIIKDSVKSCIKSIFEFIFVCFMTCRWILLILIGAIILVFVLKISIISSLLSFVLGLLLVSVFFAISAFYCYKCFVPKTETSNIILLPENFEAEIIESEISEENPEEEILSNENSEEDNATEIQESEGEE